MKSKAAGRPTDFLALNQHRAIERHSLAVDVERQTVFSRLELSVEAGNGFSHATSVTQYYIFMSIDCCRTGKSVQI